MIYIDLFLGFLKVGLFAFGGAYGAIPLIRDVVLSYGWLDDEMITYMIAVSESTPGPIMVNLATYVGSEKAGLAGALIATFAVILPAFVVILLIVSVMKNLFLNRYVQAVLQGVKPCVIGIILGVGCYMIADNCVAENTGFSPFSVKVDEITLILTVVLGGFYFGSKRIFKKSISPILLILIAAFLGLAVYSAG